MGQPTVTANEEAAAATSAHRQPALHPILSALQSRPGRAIVENLHGAVEAPLLHRIAPSPPRYNPVFVSKCQHVRFVVPKTAQASFSGCESVEIIVYDKIIGTLELINCKNVTLKLAASSVATITVDGSESVQIYLHGSQAAAPEQQQMWTVFTSKSKDVAVGLADLSSVSDADSAAATTPGPAPTLQDLYAVPVDNTFEGGDGPRFATRWRNGEFTTVLTNLFGDAEI